MKKIMAEYVWIDGTKPTPKLRSKTKIIDQPVRKLADLPEWGFDGSSTQQATGDKSDCALVPVTFIPDPVRGGSNIITLCEVYKADGSVHPSNTRWLLYRIAENYGVHATIHPKPMKGWNGTGAHTNFSIKAMRAKGGLKEIYKACERLGKKHKEHIAVYGAHNEERLMGAFEAPSIHDFSYGVSDRGASIRIPLATSKEGRGYLEDRRPAANMDPYQVCARMIETICG